MPQHITVEPLTPALCEAYLGYFDADAFVDNAGWAGCYCYFPHADHAARKWNVRSATENRAAAAGMIGSSRMSGYLAFVDGRPIGWCSANTRDQYTIFDPDGRDPGTVGVIACFVVARSYRGQGVAKALLNAAISGFAAQGIGTVEAFPLEVAETSAANHFGPLSMYLKAGFAVSGRDGQNLVVRKSLQN